MWCKFHVDLTTAKRVLNANKLHTQFNEKGRWDFYLLNPKLGRRYCRPYQTNTTEGMMDQTTVFHCSMKEGKIETTNDLH